MNSSPQKEPSNFFSIIENAVRGFSDELLKAFGTTNFWGVVIRSSVAPIGVFVFNWSALIVVVYFLVELWFYLSLRLSFEVAVDEKIFGEKAKKITNILYNGFMLFLLAAPLLLIILGLFIIPLVASMFKREEGWRDIVAMISTDPDLIIGFCALFGFLLIEIFVFAFRFPTRSAEQKALDEYRGASMVMKIVCLAIIGVFVFLTPLKSSSRLLVIIITLMSIWIEGVPRHAAKIFGYVPKLPSNV